MANSITLLFLAHRLSGITDKVRIWEQVIGKAKGILASGIGVYYG